MRSSHQQSDSSEPIINADFRILLVGASGVFGRRLAEQLVTVPGICLLLAGRTHVTLQTLQLQLTGNTEIVILDRDQVTAEQLAALRCKLVIDAAGPFQSSQTQLIEAAIASGCHYIDLADGREFVSSIERFDQAARDRNVAVISGASSTPALSHAVIDSIAEYWQKIDTIKVVISPGNRAPRGLAVMQAILSYAGQPVRVFRQSRWQQQWGWGLTHWQPFPELGRRLVSLCDTPDLDLLVKRYQPTDSALFYAGLELSLLHRGLAWLSQLVRMGILKSLLPCARILRWLAARFEPFGTDAGGMLVYLSGTDQNGQPIDRQWSLLAAAGDGPYVPTFAAVALVRRLQQQQLPFRGATACVGLLALAEFETLFQQYAIKTVSQPANQKPDHSSPVRH